MYRAGAVGHLSSPEQLDTEVRLVRPAGWIALGAVGLVLIAFIVWCFVGTVKTTFPAAGVLSTQYGTVNSVAPDVGTVAEVFVTQGEEVASGDPVATVQTAEGNVTVKAAADGTVVEMLAYPSDAVEAGGTIATIQPDDESLRCYAFVPVDSSQPIKPGMPVQISLTTVPSEEYGLLLGTVTRVGTHPATRAGVGALLNNDEITDIVVSGAPVFQIEVALTPSETTPTGYAWTSGDGPPEPLAAGTLVHSTVITAEQAPITLLLPSHRTAR
jgi:pyruvate/2-oxoglutarate dehydrogenase complex dihydrolipoamide acyltransferase (E2) component